MKAKTKTRVHSSFIKEDWGQDLSQRKLVNTISEVCVLGAVCLGALVRLTGPHKWFGINWKRTFPGSDHIKTVVWENLGAAEEGY